MMVQWVLTFTLVGPAASTLLRIGQPGPASAATPNGVILSAGGAGNDTKTASEDTSGVPCQCVANDPTWKKPTRTVPKCVFIDLGAADGNTFSTFISNGYGPVANCPSGGQWEAWLVEANPLFDGKLRALEPAYGSNVHVLASTAAFSCPAHTSFYIDADPTHNHWGSSMSPQAPDAVRSGKQKVTVPTVNVAQLIAENTIPGDWVMLKIDIEGAEYEVVPCLSRSASASLVDRLYLEEHSWFPTGSKTTPAQMEEAKAKLRAMNVDIPPYFSHTM